MGYVFVMNVGHLHQMFRQVHITITTALAVHGNAPEPFDISAIHACRTKSIERGGGQLLEPHPCVKQDGYRKYGPSGNSNLVHVVQTLAGNSALAQRMQIIKFLLGPLQVISVERSGGVHGAATNDWALKGCEGIEVEVTTLLQGFVALAHDLKGVVLASDAQRPSEGPPARVRPFYPFVPDEAAWDAAKEGLVLLRMLETGF
jgi:hypothetical protein